MRRGPWPGCLCRYLGMYLRQPPVARTLGIPRPRPYLGTLTLVLSTNATQPSQFHHANKLHIWVKTLKCYQGFCFTRDSGGVDSNSRPLSVAVPPMSPPRKAGWPLGWSVDWEDPVTV